jgi:hypothetical protein
LLGSGKILKLKTFAGTAAFLFMFATVLPAEVYTYTGLDYTSATGVYSTSEFLTATFTLADPLPANQTGFAATATSWTATDGANTLCNTCSGSDLVVFSFSTDSTGNISDWYFFATNYSGASMDSGGPLAESLGTPNADFVQADADGAESTGAGSWEDTTPSPEPGTLGMMLGGSLLLFGTMRRRAGKVSRQA